MMYGNFDSISQTANDFTKFHLKTASNDNITPKFDPLTNEKNPLGKTSAEKFKESVKSSDPKTNDPKVKGKEQSKTKSAEQEKPVQNTEKSDDTKEVEESTDNDISTEETETEPSTNESTLENLLFLQNPTSSAEENHVPNTDIEETAVNSDSIEDQKPVLKVENERDHIDVSTYTQKTETETQEALKSKIDVDSGDTLNTDETIIPETPTKEIPHDNNPSEQNTDPKPEHHQEQNTMNFVVENSRDTNETLDFQSEDVTQSNIQSIE